MHYDSLQTYQPQATRTCIIEYIEYEFNMCSRNKDAFRFTPKQYLGQGIIKDYYDNAGPSNKLFHFWKS